MHGSHVDERTTEKEYNKLALLKCKNYGEASMKSGDGKYAVQCECESCTRGAKCYECIGTYPLPIMTL